MDTDHRVWKQFYNADKTLSAGLQRKVAACYDNVHIAIYDDISHENYLVTESVIKEIKHIIKEE